jgi:hypothetical protein
MAATSPRLFGRSESSVQAVLREVRTGPTPVKRRTKWTDAENDAFNSGWNPALGSMENIRRIAEQIGRHPDGVIAKAKMAGLIQNTSADPYRPTPERADKHAAACLREGGFPSFVEAPGAGFLFRDGRAVWAWPTDRRAA